MPSLALGMGYGHRLMTMASKPSGCTLLMRIAAVIAASATGTVVMGALQAAPPSNPAPPAAPAPPPTAPPPAIPEGPDPEPDPATAPKKPPIAAPPEGATPGGSKPAAPATPAPPPTPKRIEVPAVPAGNLDRLDVADRQALDELIGWALPLPEGVTPLADGAPVFPGKVVVIQSFTSRNSLQPVRSTEQALAQMLKDPDLVVVALHTPDGAADASKRVQAGKMSAILAVDEDGSWCDALGVWKKPVNVVIDRAGTVRAAGLNRKGLVDAVKDALADRNPPKPSQRPAPEEAAAAPATKVDWPPYANAIDPKKARDLRGKMAPAMNVTQWLNGPPRLDGRLVIVDFFASWCGPCMNAVPHMNDMASRFEQDLVVVGISDEQAGTLRSGLGRAGYPVNSFRYPIGVDPSARMKKGFGVNAIPHVAVVSADGIVRWQGHPAMLNNATVSALVEANRASGLRSGTQQAKTPRSGAAPKRGWTSAG
jgi:cytochrome c biogenesis protein CcmG/thiol:disulfide interchange protein DsbE